LHKRGILIIIAIIILALSFIVVVLPDAQKDKILGKDDGMEDSRIGTRYDKTLIIGIDGTDPKVLGQLIGEGKLPNFQKLINKGSYSNLSVVVPAQSPVAWTTIATGSNPGKHNIFDFIIRNPENYLPMLSLAKPEQGAFGTNYKSDVKAKAFFQITSENNIPTTVIKWPMTFPAEKVNGEMLSGLGVPDIKGLLGSYSFYTTEKDDKSGEGAEKVVLVEAKDGVIETQISGPRKMKAGKLVDIIEPMQIRLESKKAALIIQGKEYPVEENAWSSWIEIEFNAGIFNTVNGVTKAYLHSTDPFRMYLETVQIDPKNPIQQISYPRKYSAELADEINIYRTLGLPEDTNALNEGRLDDKSFLEQCRQIEDERSKMFWKEFDKFQKRENGVLAVVFDTSDRVQHMFWEDSALNASKGVENRTSNEKASRTKQLRISKEIEDYFVDKDRFLGEVLGKIDEKTALIMVSDHGFTSFERSVNLNTWLVQNGYMHLNGKPDSNNSGELFSMVDWSKTRAYSLGFGSIYVNLKGREGEGIVDAADKDALIDEISLKLGKLKDPAYDKSAITKAYKSSDVYSGEFAANAPDIIVGFAPGYRAGWQNAVGGVTPDIFEDNKKHWKGDHIVDPSHVPGVIITNFKMTRNNASQVDVAPTILAISGVSVPESMDGKSLV